MGTLRRWLYLDQEGISSLHEQAYQTRLVGESVSQATSRDTTISAKTSGGAWGFAAEVAAQHHRALDGQITKQMAAAEEHRILEIESFLAANDGLVRIGNAATIAELWVTGRSVFVTGILRFRWAATHDIDVVQDAVTKQMVEFALDRDAHDDAGILSVPVCMAGSLGKCVSRKILHDGNLSPGSHLATFLRQLSGDALPLGFLAQLQPFPKLVYLKPFAIWFA